MCLEAGEVDGAAVRCAKSRAEGEGVVQRRGEYVGERTYIS